MHLHGHCAYRRGAGRKQGLVSACREAVPMHYVVRAMSPQVGHMKTWRACEHSAQHSSGRLARL